MISGRLPMVAGPWPLTHSEAAAVASRTASGTGRPRNISVVSVAAKQSPAPVGSTRTRTGSAVYSDDPVPGQDLAPAPSPGHHAQAAVARHGGQQFAHVGGFGLGHHHHVHHRRDLGGKAPGEVLDPRAEARPPPDQPLGGEHDET